MMKYLIAGHVVGMERVSDETLRSLADYRYDGDLPPETVFAVDPDDMKSAEDRWLERYRAEIEEDLISRQFCGWLAGRAGLYLHASAVEVDGFACLFTADSGVGKSTHARLWKQAFGDRADILNDDKPFIRLRDGVFYVCGSPWHGKENIARNREVPLRGICFLEQGAANEIFPMTPAQGVPRLLAQTFLPEDAEQVDPMLTLIGRLADAVPLYRLRCTISEDAARLAYRTMLGEGDNTP